MLDKAVRAPFFKERRMMFANATNFHRKSGAAERRDLRCASTSPRSHGKPTLSIFKNFP
jgi:hypothetical protein